MSISFSPDFTAAEGSESRLGGDVSSATARNQSEVLLVGGSRTEAFDFYLFCVLYFVAVQCSFVHGWHCFERKICLISRE